MSERKDEVVEALLVASRSCTICRSVLSAIHMGERIDLALVSGILTASSVIKDQHDLLVNKSMMEPLQIVFSGASDANNYACRVEREEGNEK